MTTSASQPPAAQRPRLLHVAVDPRGGGVGMSGFAVPAEFDAVDVYDLPGEDLASVAGIQFTGAVDQVFLARHRDLWDGFVRGGGRVIVNGHVVKPFLTGLATWRRLVYRGPRDLTITSLAAHQVWAGVDPDDLLFRTGVPGVHTPDELRRIGVAGSYGRGYHLDLPADALPVNGIGPLRAVIDYEYTLGAGRVLVHGGLDLLAMRDPQRSTAVLPRNIVDWLKGLDR